MTISSFRRTTGEQRPVRENCARPRPFDIEISKRNAVSRIDRSDRAVRIDEAAPPLN
jgi:hypothetical protein